MVLNAIMNGEGHFPFTVGKTAFRIGADDLALDDEAIAELDDNIFEGRGGVVFFRHAIDGHFTEFFTIDVVHDENFLMAGSSMSINPKRFPFIFEFTYHVIRRLSLLGLAMKWMPNPYAAKA